ncbi:Ig-like domain-containing protein [Herbiconiux sp. 11R-BC]|uniref:Ig-like domain-containing protein n=1 Tax=Herbiconiux sp. 11R-BC TaxID=3111637 RepID=UPI003C060DF4
MSGSRKGWERTPSRVGDGVEWRTLDRSRPDSGARAGSPARLVAALLFAAALFAGGLAAVGGAGAASASASPIAAAPAPTPAPSEAPAAPAPAPSTDPGGSSPTPPAEPAAPVILSPAGGAQLAGTVTVTGTGEPGSSVQVLAGGSSEPLCIVTPGDSGDWSCATTGLASSASTVIRAVQLVSGSPQQEASVTVRVLNAPVVTGGPRGPLTNAVVQGTGFAGATVTATAGSFACSGTADASGAWSCPLGGGITDGDYLVSATQSTPWSSGASPASDAVAIRVDVTVPAAPVLLSPQSGTTLPTSGSTFRGTGEDGATVSVFAGAYTICQVAVSNGSWSCAAAAVPAGSYSLAVLQQDAAGNVSVQSGPLTMLFQDASTATPTTPSGPTTAPAGPTAPASPSAGSDPAAPGPPATGDGSTPGGGAEPSSPSAPSPPGGAAPPAAGGSPVAPGSWSDATRFTAALQPAFGTGAGALWWLALVLGAVALVGIALPARLLAGTVRELAPRETPSGGARVGLAASLLGRNRRRQEYDQAPEIHISPVVTTVAVVLASAALVTLSGPVESQPAYLRLFLAVVAGLAIVNAVATVVPAALAKVTLGVVAAPRIRPALLLVSAVLALFSRLADLDPALVFGLVAGLVVAETAARSARGALATVQVLCLLVLGAAAWLASGALGVDPASSDVWGAALAELLHVVVLASFGASSALLLPVGRAPGRSLLDWSPATWTLLTIASFTALAMLFVPTLTAGTGGALLALGIATAAFAAVSVSAWVWQRYLADDEEHAR